MVDKTQPEMMFPKAEQPIESKWVPISVPPPQASPFPPQAKPCFNTQPHASPAPPLVASQATPQAKPPETNASTAQGEKDKLELYSLSKAIAQQATVTKYLIKNHKALLLPELTIPTFTGDPLEYNTFIRMELKTAQVRTVNAYSCCCSTQRDSRTNWSKSVFTWNRQKAILKQRKFYRGFMAMTSK